jgi:hypothetical protein
VNSLIPLAILFLISTILFLDELLTGRLRARWRMWLADRAAKELDSVFTCLFIFLHGVHKAPFQPEIPAVRRREINELRYFHGQMLRRWWLWI